MQIAMPNWLLKFKILHFAINSTESAFMEIWIDKKEEGLQAIEEPSQINKFENSKVAVGWSFKLILDLVLSSIGNFKCTVCLQ